MNFKALYETLGNGDIPECLGAACPQSCCRAKTKETRDGSSQSYRTSFAEGEARYQDETFGSIEATGATPLAITPINYLDPHARGFTTVALDNCTSSTAPSCKMDGRKPFICRLAPFGYSATEPFMRNCPAIVEIFENSEVVARVLRAREILGCRDNANWLSAAKSAIDLLKAIRPKT